MEFRRWTDGLAFRSFDQGIEDRFVTETWATSREDFKTAYRDSQWIQRRAERAKERHPVVYFLFTPRFHSLVQLWWFLSFSTVNHFVPPVDSGRLGVRYRCESPLLQLAGKDYQAYPPEAAYFIVRF